jgi:hypothetical protein
LSNRNDRGWYWYAEDAQVATLWSAATAARLKTANVYWPTSVGAPITYNLPQIWRTGTDDDLKMPARCSSGPSPVSAPTRVPPGVYPT